jgi:hypothetical protein
MKENKTNIRECCINTRLLLPSLLMAVLLAGCSQQILKPNVPQTVNTNAVSVVYQLDDFDKDRAAYIAAFDSNNLSLARRLRDRMISRIRADIEANYREYETHLFAGQAGFNVWSDILELSLSLATTVAGDKGTKTVLGAVLTAIKGGRLSIDKNYFREKTSEMIISKMQANRDRVKTRIVDKMVKLPVDNYTFEEAFVDLIEYFNAGTLQGAIVSLANEAGRDAVEAREELKDVELFRTATGAQVASLTVIRNEFRKLFKSWQAVQSNTDLANPLLEKAKVALRELGTPFEATDSGQVIFNSLNQQISRVTTESDRDAYLKKLSDAFRIAHIIE